MAGAIDNPSRRALLGAALGLPLVGSACAVEAAAPLHHSPAADGPPPRPGEDRWRRALAAYRAAEAAVRAEERRTAGASMEEEAAREEVYGAALDAMYAALRRLLTARAPDLAAFATKIVLAIDHEAGTLAGGEACLAAIRREAVRLLGLSR